MNLNVAIRRFIDSYEVNRCISDKSVSETEKAYAKEMAENDLQVAKWLCELRDLREKSLPY
jgi:hypothetical protein